jgi:triacylglycerol lipase
VNGKFRSIHLLAHSQGGQASRVLAHLLVFGAPDEVRASQAPSSLFKGGKPWIRSITTLSTPHDGTTLTHVMTEMMPFVQELLGTIAALAGIFSNDPVFDFKLDQFGLARQAGESIDDYLDRASSSSIFDTRDNAMWDLSPEGAKELNHRYPGPKHIYYFAWSNEATSSRPPKQVARPEATMCVMFQGQSRKIGQYTSTKAGRVHIDAQWFQNDGVVNTNSMDGPSLGTTVPIIPFTGRVQPGVWHHMGLLASIDHLDIVGVGTGVDVRPWYRSWAAFLQRLPQ